MPKKALTKNTNGKIIKNALQNVSLAGELQRPIRDEVNTYIDSNQINYVVLFKGVLGRTDYRALYKQEYTEQD